MEELVKKARSGGMTKEELNELLKVYDDGSGASDDMEYGNPETGITHTSTGQSKLRRFIMWHVVLRVLCDGIIVGGLHVNILVNKEAVEFYLCGIKFMVSASPGMVTVSTSSATVELVRANSWYSGITSEPIRNKDKEFAEFSFEAEAEMRELKA